MATKESGAATWDPLQGLASEANQERQGRFKELCLRNNVLLLPSKFKALAPLARIGDSFLVEHQAPLN
jgi:hypothetical protein